MKDAYLHTSPMLDFNSAAITQLIESRGWKGLSPYAAIEAVYNFVRDEIKFGYNKDDILSASQVLADGYGQCNTKGTLLMALLRGVGIPTRFHGFTIYNELQKGAIPNYLFMFAPKRIIHSWIEVYFDGQWLDLEGYIIDKSYLNKIQESFADQCASDKGGAFSAYGIATKCLQNPDNNWKGGNTYIQKEGIADDFGVYDQPDDFYAEKGSNLRGFKRLVFRYLLRHLINHNVAKIRSKGI